MKWGYQPFRSLAKLAREIDHGHRATDRERLAERLTVIARVLGHEGQDAVFTAAMIDRVHAGWAQRSAGAWSWGTTGVLSFGSQSTMRKCARAVLVASLVVDQRCLDPVEKYDSLPPPGASFGIAKTWSVKVIDWYDAAGNSIAARAPA